jgi:hypothetical protein
MPFLYSFQDEKTGAKWDYKSPTKLSPEEQNSLASRAKTTGVFNKQTDDSQEIHRADLETNPALKDAVKTWYRAEHGTDLEGDDKAVVTEYYRQMRDYEANLTSLGTLSARLLSGTRYDAKSRESLALMWDTWDKVAPFYNEEGKKWEGAFEAVKDYGISSVSDPTNYLELLKPVAGAFFGMGVGGVAGGAAAIAERTALKQAMKYQIKGAMRKVFANHMVSKELAKGAIVAGAKSAAKEGVIFNSLGNIAEQTAKDNIGAQEGFNTGEFLTNAAISAGVGGALGAGVGALKYPAHFISNAASDMYKGSRLQTSVSASPLYSKFFDTYGRTPDNIAKAQRNEAKKAISIREADVIKSYLDLTDIARSDIHGEERKAIRDEHFTVFKDRLATYMDKDTGDAYFAGNTIGFDDITKSTEVLQSIYSQAKVEPSDDIHAITRKILDMDAGTVVNSSQKINGKVVNLTGVQQQQATLIALENHFANSIHVTDMVEDNSVNAVANMDTFLSIAQRNNETASMFGSGLQMNKNRFKITDDLVGTFRALSPEEKIVSTDRAGKFDNSDDMVHFMAEMSTIYNMYTGTGGVGLGAKRFAVKSSGWIEDTFKSAIMNKPSVAVYNLTTSLAHSMTMPIEGLLTGLKTSNKRLTNESLAQLAYPISQFHDLQQTFMYGARAFLTSRSVFTDRSLGEQGTRDMLSKDFDLRRIKRFGLTDRKAWMTEGEDDPIGNVHLGFRFLGNGVKMFSKRMGIAGDELVQTAAFRSKAYGIAVVDEMAKGVGKEQAVKNALKRTNDAMRSQIVAHMRGGMSDDPLAKIAMDEALDATWKIDLKKGWDVGNIGRYVQGLKNPHYKATDGVGKVWAKAYGSLAVELLVPFIRTPANLLNYTFEHTPYLSMASKKFRTAMKSADPEVREAAQSKVAMGAAFWTIAMYQAMSGDIQGGGAENMLQRKVQGGGDDEGSRRIKYSMDMGDGKRLPFSRLDPLFTAHKVMADVADVARYGKPQDTASLVANLVLQFADMFESMPTLQGLAKTTDVLKTITASPELVSDERKGKAGEKYLSGFVNPLMPTYWVSSVMREVLGDDGMEEATSIVSAVKKDIGFMASKVGFDYNTGLNRIYDPVLSTIMKKDSWNPLYAHQEDTKLNDVLNDMQLAAPNSIKNNGKVDLSKATHTDSGRSYFDYLQQTVGTLRMDENSSRNGYEKFMVGHNLKEALEAFTNSPEFGNAASLADPLTKYQSGSIKRGEYPQQKVIRDIVEWYRARADDIVLQEAEKLMKQGDPEATAVYNSWTSK